MPWQVTLHPELPIIETRYEGLLSPAVLAEAIEGTLALVKESGRNLLLGDCTALVGGHSITDLYYLADAVKDSGLSHRLKEAVIFPELPAPAGHVKFWETTCYNRGIRVRIFTDRQGAIDWLLQGD